MPKVTRVRHILVISPTISSSGSIGSDQIGLHSSLYKKLFGRRFGHADKAKPRRRRIVTVIHIDDKKREWRVRRLFRSGAWHGVSERACLLSRETQQQLGIRQHGATVLLYVESQWFARLMFFWNHPEHHARVAFKLGMVAILVALFQLVLAVLRLG